MHMANWYIKNGRYPSVDDEAERLEYLRKTGKSPYAFNFKSDYTIDDLKVYLDTML